MEYTPLPTWRCSPPAPWTMMVPTLLCRGFSSSARRFTGTGQGRLPILPGSYLVTHPCLEVPGSSSHPGPAFNGDGQPCSQPIQSWVLGSNSSFSRGGGVLQRSNTEEILFESLSLQRVQETWKSFLSHSLLKSCLRIGGQGGGLLSHPLPPLPM